MKKIFVDNISLEVGTEVYFNKNILKGGIYNHLTKSLRVKINEKFTIGDNKNEFLCVVKSITSKDIVLFITEEIKKTRLSLPNITLFFSILKGGNNELVIQKCTEIGISKFVPVVTKNTVIKIDEKNGKNRLDRWREIAKESSSQSNRLSIPDINPIISFNEIINYKEIINYEDNDKLKLFGKISATCQSFKELLKDNKKDIYIFIGPEGDFTNDEIKLLEDLGWVGISFHSNILRSETASIYVCASIFSFFTF